LCSGVHAFCKLLLLGIFVVIKVVNESGLVVVIAKDARASSKFCGSCADGELLAELLSKLTCTGSLSVSFGDGSGVESF
jgi:hypothetical protein